MPTLYYTYELVIVETGQVFYVGKGNGYRMFHHGSVLNKPDTKEYQRPVYKRMREVLKGRPFVERKVFEHEDETTVLLEEQRRIRAYGFENLVNTQSHAFTGRKLKPEVGRLIGKRLRAYADRCRAQYGQGLPPETVRKIQKALENYVVPPEVGRKISATKSGVPFTHEHRSALKVKHTYTKEGLARRWKWSPESILELVRVRGFKTRQEWINASHRSYRLAWEWGLMGEATKLMAPRWSVVRRGHTIGLEHRAKILAGARRWAADPQNVILRLLESASYKFADLVLRGYRPGRVRCVCARCGTVFYVNNTKAKTRRACSLQCGRVLQAKTISETLQKKRLVLC